MFDNLEALKPALRELVAALRERFAYASVLATQERYRAWRVSRSGVSVGSSDADRGSGFVVRVFDETGCAEYSFNEFSRDRIGQIVERLCAGVKEQNESLGGCFDPLPTGLPDDTPVQIKKDAKVEIDPETLGDEKILAMLGGIREKGVQNEGILDVMLGASCSAERKIFISGHRDLDETHFWTDAFLVALAARGEEVKDYYCSYSTLGGMEVLRDVEKDLDHAVCTVRELLSAEPITPGEYECICDPDVTGMIVHEAFGHGVEMDMFVKDRALARRCIGEYVASPMVTMHDGSTVEQTATWAFDDEGNLTGDTVIIDRGVLKTGMCDALSASRLGIAPTGNGRRESYERKAYTRMTNTWFEGGEATLDEMIATVQHGFLLENPSSGMEDPKNWGIQCMVNIAREIRDGKLTGRIFSPIVLTGYVPDLLKSVSMMGKGVVLKGGGYCGKGYKEWVKVSDGGPCMKARIRLG